MFKNKKHTNIFSKPYSLVTILPWLVLVTGLFITLHQWRQALDYAEETLDHRFEIAFNEVTDRLNDYIDDYAKLLKAARGHFNASDDVTREEFHIFVSNLDISKTFPGLMGLGYTSLITPENLHTHERSVQDSGFPDYQIYPAGERDIYTSILYLEPFNAVNQKAFGYDMYSETNRREAMKQSVMTDSPALSAGVELVQGKTRINDGLLMYLPLYDVSSETSGWQQTGESAKQNGWVYLVFRASDLVSHILQKSQVNDIQITDVASRQDLSLFDIRDEDNSNFTEFTKTITVAGRQWQLISKPDKNFYTEYRSGSPWQTLIIGSLLAILLTCITALLVVGRQKAMRLARRMTQQLQDQHMRLRLATNTARIGVWQWDFAKDTVRQERGTNDAQSSFRHDSQEQDFADWISSLDSQYRQAVADKLHALSENGQEDIIELPIRQADNELKILQLSVGSHFDEQRQLTGLIGMTLDITEDWQMQKQLELTEARWKLALEGSGEGVWDWWISENKVIFSDKLMTMLGYQPGSFEPELHEWQSRVHPEDLPAAMQDLAAMLDGSQPDYRNEHRLQCQDGSWKWMLDKGTVVERDADGNPLRAIGTLSDISWRKDAEIALQQSEERFRNAFDTAAIGMALVGLDGRWLEVNDSLCEMVGYSETELLSMDYMQITLPEDLDLDQHYVNQLLSGELDHYHMEKRYFCKNGETIDVLLSVSVVHDAEGKVLHFVSQIEDITARKIEEDRMRELAFYDALTGLPNRRLFDERLEQAMLMAKRNRHFLALMFIDVDHFKNINDQHGHDIGDAVIKTVGGNLRSALRASDTVARIGGDEFIVLLSEVKSEAAAVMVANNLRTLFDQQLSIEGHSLKVTLSIGVAVADSDSKETAAHLRKKADIALYEVKARGRDAVAVYQD